MIRFLLTLVAFYYSSIVFADGKLLAVQDFTNRPGILLAQMNPDEAFDPFADYSEFDEASDEEADINFFKNGRFFTIGLAGGIRNFTGSYARAYGSAPTFGLFLSYFFDLKFALQMGFMTGDHSVNFETNASKYSGIVSFTTMNFDLKYYLNTQNVTRGLADLNPYALLGLAQFYRTYSIANIDGFSRDTTMGVNIGAGLEIPLMRKKAFLGFQGTYRYVSFADESKDVVSGTERLTEKLSGDMWDGIVILGFNF